jgi:putative endopeptidase
MFRIRLTLRRALAAALSLAAFFPLLAGAAPPVATSGTAAAPAAVSPSAAAGTHGIDVSAIDRSVTPGDDFFRYANGAWLKRTEIPPDRSSWGTFSVLAELTDRRIDELIGAASASAAAGSEARKVADYYDSFMDEATIERLGAAPLAAGLKQIDAVSDRASLSLALGRTLRADVDVLNSTSLHTENLFGLWVAQDLDDPTRYSPFLLQGGLVMPDRDYYLSSSQKMADIRERYRAHIAAVLRLAGFDSAEARAARIYELEKRIAAGHWSLADSEEVQKGNNHWAAADFSRLAPGLEWREFFAGAGLGEVQEFVVWQPSAVTVISALTASAPLDTWKDFLRFHYVEAYSPFLAKAFVAEHFAFHAQTLSGTPQQRERWKRAVAATNDALQDAVGRLYVARYFPPDEKARAEALVHNLIVAMGTRIDRLTWMTPATREKAKGKLATLKVGVGYPDHWRDYSGLNVVRGDAFGNVERAQLFDYRSNLAKLGKRVDRGEWAMPAQVIDAVNLPAMNAINFPAAILQPPFFDSERDSAMNYGSIGAVIGHEISHSFDDQGALFDASGTLRNWWTKEDFAHFQAAGDRLVAQYNAYHPFPDVSVNGKQTLSENIADVAGLSVAYDAWRLTLQGHAAPAAEGFSAGQLFFLAFAQSWQEKAREPALRRLLVTDGHAPPEYRADTVRNLDAWYDTFDIKPGQALYLAPADRVRVW